MSSDRIQITRTQLVAQFVEVENAPAALIQKFEKPPFFHLLSKYVIRPVACDQKPFFIHHKNKQQIVVSKPFKMNRGKKNTGEVNDLSDDGKNGESDDDEFEKVTGDNKRQIAKKRTEVAPVAEANPLFPASDPGNIKVIQRDPAKLKELKEKKEQKLKEKLEKQQEEGDKDQTKPEEAKKETVTPEAAKNPEPVIEEPKPVPKVKIEKALPVPAKVQEKAPASARGNAKKEKQIERNQKPDDTRAATDRKPVAAAPAKPKPSAATNDIMNQFKMVNEGTKQEFSMPNENNKKGGKNNTKGQDNKQDQPQKSAKGEKKPQEENKKSDKQVIQPKEAAPAKEETKAPKKGKQAAENKDKNEKKPAQEEKKSEAKPKSAKPAAPKENVLEQTKSQGQKKAPKAQGLDAIMKNQAQEERKKLEEKKHEVAKSDPFDFVAQMQLGNQMSQIQDQVKAEKRTMKQERRGKGAPTKPSTAQSQKTTITQKNYGGKSDFEKMMEKR